jgi:hypothetical protein
LAAEVAARVGESSEPFGDPSAHALAFELYRESLHWILAHQAEVWNGLGESADDKTASAASPTTFQCLRGLRARPSQRVLEVVGGQHGLEVLIKTLETGTFDRFADFPCAEQCARTETLRAVVEALLGELGQAEQFVERLRRERVARLLLVPALLAGIGLLRWVGVSFYERTYDLARGKPWRASSHYPGGCTSPAQSCRESPDFFFHTEQQDSPWLEIDLGRTQTFSGLYVANRADCCGERALPLVLTVSSNQVTWREVARQQTPFDSWHTQFNPVSARWVRLVAANTTMLHLAQVRILP